MAGSGAAEHLKKLACYSRMLPIVARVVPWVGGGRFLWKVVKMMKVSVSILAIPCVALG